MFTCGTGLWKARVQRDNNGIHESILEADEDCI